MATFSLTCRGDLDMPMYFGGKNDDGRSGHVNVQSRGVEGLVGGGCTRKNRR